MTLADEVGFAGADGAWLAATLTRPAASGPVPAVLLVNGSGPLDRNSDLPGQPLGLASALAEVLAANGVASLRFDKRGVGASDGDYLSTGFDDEVADAAAALAAIARLQACDPGRIGVIGHSVGATIAIRLAAGNRVAAGVLLAAAVRPGAEVMRWQTQQIAETLPWWRRRRFATLADRARATLAASTADVVRIDGTDQPARWLREYMAYDPAGDLRAIRCPILALTGRADIQVAAADVAAIGAAVGGSFTGRTPEDVTHVLRRATRRRGLAGYAEQLRSPPDDDVLAEVATFVAAVL